MQQKLIDTAGDMEYYLMGNKAIQFIKAVDVKKLDEQMDNLKDKVAVIAGIIEVRSKVSPALPQLL